ncbi:MAG: hypothetical protein WCJ19_00925 [bacterium]
MFRKSPDTKPRSETPLDIPSNPEFNVRSFLSTEINIGKLYYYLYKTIFNTIYLSAQSNIRHQYWLAYDTNATSLPEWHIIPCGKNLNIGVIQINKIKRSHHIMPALIKKFKKKEIDIPWYSFGVDSSISGGSLDIELQMNRLQGSDLLLPAPTATQQVFKYTGVTLLFTNSGSRVSVSTSLVEEGNYRPHIELSESYGLDKSGFFLANDMRRGSGMLLKPADTFACGTQFIASALV